MKAIYRVTGLVAVLILMFSNPAFSVTDGYPDNEDHPHVGLLIFDVGMAPAWRCSGTLISPTIMLTAGHCTEGADGGRVWFDTDEATVRGKGYPFGGSGAIEFSRIIISPDYNPAAFFLNDIGLVELSVPVILPTYGELPATNQLNALAKRRGKSDQTFTAVGYGLQQINPVFIKSALDRMAAEPRLIQINVPGFTGDFSILLSNNHATGGTCFGDSGGPNFLGSSDVIGGVTSFGINGNCAGTGGVYRLDRVHDLLWIDSILNQ